MSGLRFSTSDTSKMEESEIVFDITFGPLEKEAQANRR